MTSPDTTILLTVDYQVAIGRVARSLAHAPGHLSVCPSLDSLYVDIICAIQYSKELMMIFYKQSSCCMCSLYVKRKTNVALCYVTDVSLTRSWHDVNIFCVLPRVGSGVVRIDVLRFLTECHTRRLNQALSVLSLGLGYIVVFCWR